MNADQLKLEIKSSLDALEALQKNIADVLLKIKPTLNPAGVLTGDNGCAMEAIIRLLENPTCPATLKPILNKAHKAFYRNAQFNLQESIREKTEELQALMPAQMRPKNAKKVSQVKVPLLAEESEITAPALLLQASN